MKLEGNLDKAEKKLRKMWNGHYFILSGNVICVSCRRTWKWYPKKPKPCKG